MNANLLIDTGATCTNIDNGIVNALGLQPTGTVPVHTPSTGGTPAMQQAYDIGLLLVGQSANTGFGAHHIANLPVLGSDFSAQGIDGLLGRDVLRLCRMTYGGVDNMVMLSF